MKNLVESIQKLSPELQQEVEDFIQCRNQKEFNHEDHEGHEEKLTKKEVYIDLKTEKVTKRRHLRPLR